MKKFISFSGGVESSTMCVLFGNKADAIFADTGFEHQQIYERIELVEKWVQDFHRPDFKIYKVTNEKHGTLVDYIRQSRFYPSYQSRFCTRMFKIEPIDNFLKQFEKEGAEIMIGLNYEESEKRTGNHGLLSFVQYSYPLVENNLTREACKLILKRANLYPDFPVYMKRGGCVGCYYKSKNEYTAMALINPEEFKIVENLEKDLNTNENTRDKYFSILENKTMTQIREEALNSMFSASEMYATINDATNCGVFCNR